LHIAEASYGKDHPETTVILSNLAIAYYQQGKFDDAESTLRRTLTARLKTFGPDDKTVAANELWLARVLAAKGNYEEARAEYAASLQIQERNAGPKALEVALTLEEFAKVLRRMSSNDEASVMEARAKFIRAETEYTVHAKEIGRVNK
jgi:tetratricopeptide (TPR) repeat protein